VPNSQQDVRVKISAEGIAEVVEAFQKISKEAKKTGEEGGKAFEQLNEKFKELGKNLLGGLALEVLVDKFKELFEQTLEQAEALTRLAAQTGLSTAAIQGLQKAARETGLASEVANAAIQKFTVAVGKAQIGSKQSTGALHDLGISVAEIGGLSADDKITLVAQRLAAIADPARRARDEIALFGRAGIEADQMLVKIGQEGLDPFIEKLKDLGLFLDSAAIADLKRTAETLKELGDEVKGTTTQFVVGFIPALEKTASELIRATNASGNAAKSFGSYLGDAVEGLGEFVIDAGKQFGALAFITVRLFVAVKEAIKDLVHGNFDQAKKEFEKFREEYNELEREFEADRKARHARYEEPPPPPKPEEGAGEGVTGLASAQEAALAKAKYDLLVVQLDNQLKLYQAHSKLETDIAENQYKSGLISLKDYYAQRAAIIAADFDKRIATAQAKARAEAALPEEEDPTGVAAVKREEAQARAQGEIAELQAQRTEALKASTNELAAAQTALDQKQIAAEEKLLELAGKKTEAAKLKLAAEIAALDIELRQAGVSDPQRAGAEASAAKQGSAQINFDQTQQEAKAALSELETATKQINDQVRDGQLFSITGQAKIIALDKERLPLLQQQADELVRIAKLSGDPALIAQADAYKQKIDAIKVSTNEVGQAMAQLNQGLENAAGKGLDTFLTDLTKHTKTLKETFKDAALSVVEDIEKMAQKALEAQIMKSLFGGAGGGGGLGALFGGAAAAAAATGGLITGPGTGTSDSVPLLASSGEFVVNAQTTAQPGVMPLLEALNGGKLKSSGAPTSVPKYAQGGVVGMAPGASSQKIVNVLDPSTLGDHLQTDAGEKAILNIISRNPTHIRSALG